MPKFYTIAALAVLLTACAPEIRDTRVYKVTGVEAYGTYTDKPHYVYTVTDGGNFATMYYRTTEVYEVGSTITLEVTPSE